MIIIEQIQVKNESDIIYAKRTLQNILKRKNNDKESFLVFCLMELSTNLLKHADGGELWIIEDKNSQIHLCSLDCGKGIENIYWAMENGTSQKENSLGVGLFQMNNDEMYHIEIVSFTKENLHGTIVLISPRDFDPHVCSLQIPFVQEMVCGDLFARKGRFLLLIDGSGHGKKAYTTSQYIKSFFYEHPFSCVLVDEFFDTIHNHLKEKKLRGAVVSIIEISSQTITSCGVGNISFWAQKGYNYEYISQKDGIIGEVFSRSDQNTFQVAKNEKLIMATDGIDVGKMDKMLEKIPKASSSLMIALCAMHFTSVIYDDKTIVIINQKGKEDERRF